MNKDERRIVLDVEVDDKDPSEVNGSVAFCENSASLQIANMTIHIPWSELAQWQVWLAQRVEEEG